MAEDEAEHLSPSRTTHRSNRQQDAAVVEDEVDEDVAGLDAAQLSRTTNRNSSRMQRTQRQRRAQSR